MNIVKLNYYCAVFTYDNLQIVLKISFWYIFCVAAYRRSHARLCQGTETLEARRAEIRAQRGPGGGDSEPSPHQLGAMGEHCNLPSGIRGGALEKFARWTHYEPRNASCGGKMPR